VSDEPGAPDEPRTAADDLYRVDRLEDLPEPAPDATYVVVDTIISSTTIIRLLEAGASSVRPFPDPESARAFRRNTDDAFLVGEQGGQPVDGFDSGPLPSHVADHDLEGRPVGILSSNGTRAMGRIGHDRSILVGSTVNAPAVAEALAAQDREAWLVAAGRGGDPTPEDTAGVDLIAGHYQGGAGPALTDRLREAVAECETAAWLRETGYGHEVDALCEFGSSGVVPWLRDGAFVDGG
jgi:2-phosphosulfolactate phosphatase